MGVPQDQNSCQHKVRNVEEVQVAQWHMLFVHLQT